MCRSGIYLKDRIVSAADVAGVPAQVEPPYPDYRRLMQALQTYGELARHDDGELLPRLTKAKLSPATPTPASHGSRDCCGWWCTTRPSTRIRPKRPL
jgi:hypothetical protein